MSATAALDYWLINSFFSFPSAHRSAFCGVHIPSMAPKHRSPHGVRVAAHLDDRLASGLEHQYCRFCASGKAKIKGCQALRRYWCSRSRVRGFYCTFLKEKKAPRFSHDFCAAFLGFDCWGGCPRFAVHLLISDFHSFAMLQLGHLFPRRPFITFSGIFLLSLALFAFFPSGDAAYVPRAIRTYAGE